MQVGQLVRIVSHINKTLIGKEQKIRAKLGNLYLLEGMPQFYREAQLQIVETERD